MNLIERKPQLVCVYKPLSPRLCKVHVSTFTGHSDRLRFWKCDKRVGPWLRSHCLVEEDAIHGSGVFQLHLSLQCLGVLLQSKSKVNISTCTYGFKSHPRQLIFLRKSDCLGHAVLLCLVVCLTLLASFFLPSHLSLKHVHKHLSHTECLYRQERATGTLHTCTSHSWSGVRTRLFV